VFLQPIILFCFFPVYPDAARAYKTIYVRKLGQRQALAQQPVQAGARIINSNFKGNQWSLPLNNSV
jgi:hypothetical protein